MFTHINQLASFTGGSTGSSSIDSNIASNIKGIWVPSSRLVIHSVAKPTAPKRKWPQLLPWLIEDRVLEPIEKMHLKLLGSDSENIKVLAVSKADMEEWLSQIESTAATELHPDFMALPWHEGQISLAWQAGSSTELVVRCGQYQGFSGEAELMSLMLSKLVSENEESQIVACMNEADIPIQLADMVSATSQVPNWQSRAPDEVTNLLIGEFLPAGKSGIQFSAQHWASAALVLITLTLAYTWLLVDKSKLQAEVESLERIQSQSFARLFPNVPIQDGDLEYTLDKLESDRFVQRDKLNEAIPSMLIALDDELSRCDCGLQSLQLDMQGGELLINKAELFPQGAVAGEGVQVSRMTDSESGLTLVSLSRENY